MEDTAWCKSTNGIAGIDLDGIPKEFHDTVHREQLYIKSILGSHHRDWPYPCFRILARIYGGYLLGYRLSEAVTSIRAGLPDEEVDSIIWLSAKLAARQSSVEHSSQSDDARIKRFHALFRGWHVQFIRELCQGEQPELDDRGIDTSEPSYQVTEDWWDFRLKAAQFDLWEQYLIYLHVYEEMSIREIADQCGYAKSSIHDDINRIMDWLQSE